MDLTYTIAGMPVYTDRYLTDSKPRRLRKSKARTASLRHAYQRVRRAVPVVYMETPKKVIYRVGDALVMHPAMLSEFCRQMQVAPKAEKLEPARPAEVSFTAWQFDMKELMADNLLSMVKTVMKDFPPKVDPFKDYFSPRFELPPQYEFTRQTPKYFAYSPLTTFV